MTTRLEEPGDNCLAGGIAVTDAGGTRYVCHGATGQTGADGATGAEGAPGQNGTSVTTAVEPAGENCAGGGVSISDAGVTTYLCHGQDAASNVGFGGDTSGSHTTFGDENWSGSVPVSDNMFHDFTVSAGTTLEVPSGTTILATGTVTIDGTIRVLFGTGNETRHPSGDPEAGWSRVPATDNDPGEARPEFQLRHILNPGFYGGGNGSRSSGYGSEGGGALVIRAAEGITINGQITADGGDAYESASRGGNTGGGAGGFVILASKGAIDGTGIISAQGGSGGTSWGAFGGGAGGGGSGGVVHLLGPQPGGGLSIRVEGGPGGHAGGDYSWHPNYPGGAGGAMGAGGGTPYYNSSGIPATSGREGLVLYTYVENPGILF